MKDFNALLRAAFNAGAQYAQKTYYDDQDDPAQEQEKAYRAWRERWTGRPHDPEPQPGDGPEYHIERQAWRERQADFGAYMGHPGGHYG